MELGALNRADDRPPYRQIADHLRAAIERGELRPGDRLPSVVQSYLVDEDTQGNLVDFLAGEGAVEIDLDSVRAALPQLM